MKDGETMIRFVLVTALFLAAAGARATEPHGAPLVDAAWLIANAGAPGIKVMEIATEEAGFEHGHVPGAILSRYEADGWRVDYDGLPGMLPPPPLIENLLGRLGIGEEDHVVLVAASSETGTMAASARVFWTLRMMGHSHLSLLDGGMAAYRASDGPTAAKPTGPSPTRYHAAPTQHFITDADGVYAGGDYDTPPIDLRPTAHHGGEAGHPLVKRRGTILDAVSVPAEALLASGLFKGKAALAALFDDIIGDPPGPVVVFSDTGHLAALGWFVLRELLGHDARLYDGSFVDWEDQGREVWDETDDMGGPIG